MAQVELDPFRRLRWLGYVFDNLDVLSKKVGLTVVDIFDCGMFGCAFRTAEGPVVKVTSDEGEARAWGAILNEKTHAPEELRGFADVYDIRELKLKPFPRPLHVIVREPLDNVSIPEALKTQLDWLTTFAQIGRINEFNAKVNQIDADYPEMHDVLVAVVTLTNRAHVFVYDLQEANLGVRPSSSSFVLRDPSNPHLPRKQWRAKRRLTM